MTLRSSSYHTDPGINAGLAQARGLGLPGTQFGSFAEAEMHRIGLLLA